MKLVIAIINNDDCPTVLSEITKGGFSATKLSTSGGFLRAGNSTLLIGVDDDKYDGAMAIIEKICKSREQITASATPMGSSAAGGVYVPYPIRVTVGGATVFVLEVSQFLKV